MTPLCLATPRLTLVGVLPDPFADGSLPLQAAAIAIQVALAAAITAGAGPGQRRRERDVREGARRADEPHGHLRRQDRRSSVPDGLADLSYKLVEGDESQIITGELTPENASRFRLHRARSRFPDGRTRRPGRGIRRGRRSPPFDRHRRARLRPRIVDTGEAASRMRALYRHLFVTDAVVERGIELLDRT